MRKCRARGTMWRAGKHHQIGSRGRCLHSAPQGPARRQGVCLGRQRRGPKRDYTLQGDGERVPWGLQSCGQVWSNQWNNFLFVFFKYLTEVTAAGQEEGKDPAVTLKENRSSPSKTQRGKFGGNTCSHNTWNESPCSLLAQHSGCDTAAGGDFTAGCEHHKLLSQQMKSTGRHQHLREFKNLVSDKYS